MIVLYVKLSFCISLSNNFETVIFYCILMLMHFWVNEVSDFADIAYVGFMN